ncbi:MAG: allantoinase AllB [Gracilibacteraceae bacterium]|jgi:allantoinase|nr:allantoinase AllB [Gracilibacteraceae bacterium]
MSYDLLIKNAEVVLDNGPVRLDIAVGDGKIACLRENITEPAAETVDAAGLHVLPGVVDAHVHFDEPGRSEWETVADGSTAFAAGGGTVFIDMPLNSFPTTCDPEAFAAKLAVAAKDARTDFALWAGLTPYSLDKLEALAEAGAVGFKAFACFTGVGGIDRADDYTLYAGMKKLAALDLPLMVHAENAEITRGLTEEFTAAGRLRARDYFASRPIITETENVGRLIHFAGETGCRVFIAHVSTARAVTLVTEARARGVDIHCETIGHYLAFNEDDVERLGAAAKCSPPIRNRENQTRLWAKILSGEIAFISSDHSPCEPSLKEGPFLQAWGGITACQSTLPLMLTFGCAERALGLPALTRLLAGNAGELFRLPGKGRIAVGYDADFAFVDLGREFTLRAEDLLYKHQVSLYTGYAFRGAVRRTMLRGRTVFLDGKIVSAPQGRFVRPERRK